MHDDYNKRAMAQQQGDYALDTKLPTPDWAHCGVEEKIERLRQELLNAREMRRAAFEREGRQDTTLYQLQYHQHSAAGEVLVPLREGGIFGLGECGQSISSSYDPLA